ncbi:MAG: hypothetical protein HYT15_03970 [Candidatus Magasanikbacteria bacterium]|nr:hypothetical protein [Candidatus Magasanikbacteria bacterium]
MKAFILLCCFAALTACEMSPPAWEEAGEQETVTVYACGGWQQPQIDQIKEAIADINANARYENENQFFAYGGEKPGLYGSGENNGVRCVYWIYSNYPTQAGRDMWNGARSANESDWLAGEYDGENVFVYGNGTCPVGTSCTWMMQNVVTHELGHALGAGHLGDDQEGVLTSRPSSAYVTGADVEEICDHASCDSNYHGVAAKLTEETYDRLAAVEFHCLNE